jgi:hypothetical protein
MALDEGVVDADIGEAAGEHQGLGLEAFQEDLQVGAEEAGVAALADAIVRRAHVHLVRDLGERRGLDAVHALAAVELAPEVNMVGAMDLLEEDDGHAGLVGHVNQLPGADHPLGIALHDRNAVGHPGPLLQKVRFLYIDDQQHRPALDDLANGYGALLSFKT